MAQVFLISIDTEGDNIWNWTYGDRITSENSAYLSRFQKLCEKYRYKPTYLTNYEMAMDERFVSMAKDALKRGQCEIGMHLHAYNNPPFYQLNVAHKDNFPYLIEYPIEVMEKKIEELTQLLNIQFGMRPRVHRAGRWALNDEYLGLLRKHGYTVDCSVTPGVNWSSTAGSSQGSAGSDYSHFPSKPYYIREGLIEIPVSIVEIHQSFVKLNSLKNFARNVKHRFLGQKVWIRPNGSNINEILAALKKRKSSEDEYIMFMLHSSEMMPGGSPTFPDEQSIEKLYSDIDAIFRYTSDYCIGKTIGEYADGLVI